LPTYQYACTECGHRFEAVQSFSDDALTECPQCTGRLRKVFNSVGIVFKGSGFYRTDSREKPADGAAKDGAKTDGPKTDGAKTDGGKTDGSKSDGAKTGGAKTGGAKPAPATSGSSSSGSSGSSPGSSTSGSAA
jgi:putative FmdB family regulatory protein